MSRYAIGGFLDGCTMAKVYKSGNLPLGGEQHVIEGRCRIASNARLPRVRSPDLTMQPTRAATVQAPSRHLHRNSATLAA
jgi:hypothetical protein